MVPQVCNFLALPVYVKIDILLLISFPSHPFPDYLGLSISYVKFWGLGSLHRSPSPIFHSLNKKVYCWFFLLNFFDIHNKL